MSKDVNNCQLFSTYFFCTHAEKLKYQRALTCFMICGVSLDLPADGRLYHTGPMHIIMVRSNCGGVVIKQHYQHIFLHISISVYPKCYVKIKMYVSHIQHYNLHPIGKGKSALCSAVSFIALLNEQIQYTKRGIGPPSLQRGERVLQHKRKRLSAFVSILDTHRARSDLVGCRVDIA